MATHRFALSAGHRNNGRGGASRGPEIEWSYPMTVKVKNEIIRRGGEAFIVSEVDGDGDPSFTYRELGATAKLAVDIGMARGGIDAYLSFHYGAEPINGAFFIYPDATGLRPAGAYWPSRFHQVDTRGNNTLDIRLARVIAKHVAKTGMPIRGDGTMSEAQSGVGLLGWRLGEMEGTAGVRDTVARLVLEAGNSLSPDELKRMWDPAWQDKYARAVVDGLEEVFGKFSSTATPPADKPKVDPNEGMPRTFRLRFDTYIRRSPGFWDAEKNESNVIQLLKAGTTGEVIGGPKVVDGVEFYDLKIAGFGTGWVQDQVLHTLEIKG